jgi:hypothetical protein
LSRGTETPEQLALRLENAVKELAAGEVQPFWEMKLVNADKVEAYVAFSPFAHQLSSIFFIVTSSISLVLLILRALTVYLFSP